MTFVNIWMMSEILVNWQHFHKVCYFLAPLTQIEHKSSELVLPTVLLKLAYRNTDFYLFFSG